MDRRLHTRLTHDPLSPGAAHDGVATPAAGAVVVFTGTVRDATDGRAVAGLAYEAYVERAEAQLDELARRVATREGVVGVWMEHRLGELAVGEAAVVVAVAAGHRDQAFTAARDGIDTLKATVAIWKEEHWADGGSHWPGA